MSSSSSDASSSTKKEQFRMLPKVINGGIAGIVGVTCVFPIDLCKTRLQNQKIGPNGERLYKNIGDCFVKTLRNEGFFGMYRGSAVNIVLITPEKAIKLVGNDFFRHHLADNQNRLTLFREMVAGGSAGFCQIVVTTPMELLKIHGQTSGAAGGPRESALEVTRRLLGTQGPKALYKGFCSTALRDVTFSAVYFPLFAHCNHLGADPVTGHSPFYFSLIAGLGAGAFSSWIVTPLDVIKTRLQTITAGAHVYSGVPHAFNTILREEGVRAFFKGGLARVCVMAPLFGIAQAVYYIGIAERFLGTFGV